MYGKTIFLLAKTVDDELEVAKYDTEKRLLEEAAAIATEPYDHNGEAIEIINMLEVNVYDGSVEKRELALNNGRLVLKKAPL